MSNVPVNRNTFIYLRYITLTSASLDQCAHRTGRHQHLEGCVVSPFSTLPCTRRVGLGRRSSTPVPASASVSCVAMYYIKLLRCQRVSAFILSPWWVRCLLNKSDCIAKEHTSSSCTTVFILKNVRGALLRRPRRADAMRQTVQFAFSSTFPRWALAFCCLLHDAHSPDLVRVRVGHSLHFFLGVQTLQAERRRSCSQIDAPPHSLHRERKRRCSQIPDPPHSLHLER